MGLIEINHLKCTQCGLCAIACPVGIVVVGERFPETVEKIEKRCITCGHCVAACPTAALSHCRMAPEECMDLASDWRPPVEKMEQLVKGRRSIRRYRPDQVDRSIIEKLLDIVRYAPTGMNVQQVQWQVYLDPAELEQLTSITVDWLYTLLAQGAPGIKGMLKAWERGEDPILRNAPHLIIAHGKANDPAANYSSIIALTTLELAALSFGLGTCWAGFLFQAANKYEELYDALNLPPGHIMYGGLVLGYPEFEYARIPTRKTVNATWR
ncbi:MAG: nitroreductase family protein [Desulfuromonadales bacterium]|nr:nitroreductase family protein [Desulfuromonadales bacterium]